MKKKMKNEMVKKIKITLDCVVICLVSPVSIFTLEMSTLGTPLESRLSIGLDIDDRGVLSLDDMLELVLGPSVRNPAPPAPKFPDPGDVQCPDPDGYLNFEVEEPELLLADGDCDMAVAGEAEELGGVGGAMLGLLCP